MIICPYLWFIMEKQQSSLNSFDLIKWRRLDGYLE